MRELLGWLAYLFVTYGLPMALILLGVEMGWFNGPFKFFIFTMIVGLVWIGHFIGRNWDRPSKPN